MIEERSQITQRNAIRMLEEEARQRAASVESQSADHDFYLGVITAAQDHLHPQNRAVRDERWLSLQAPAFKDGYLETCTLIGIAGVNSPFHLLLPTPH